MGKQADRQINIYPLVAIVSSPDILENNLVLNVVAPCILFCNNTTDITCI